MGNKYLDILCPNRPDQGKSFVCRGKCGGISTDSLRHFDFQVPFVDLRYCGSCRRFFKVIIKSKSGPLYYEMIEKGELLNLVEPESLMLLGIIGNPEDSNV